MIVQLVAAGLTLALLWALFRFAMGLRYAKIAREEARRAEEAHGRRVLAEIPLDAGVVFFLEDAEAFRWGASEARKRDIVGARMLLDGVVIAASSREGASLPDLPPAEHYEGRERWEVVLYLKDGTQREVACGALREGVSREVAARIFEAVRAVCEAARRAGREP